MKNTQLELFNPKIYKKDVEAFCDKIEGIIEQRSKTRITKIKTLSLPLEEIKSLIVYVRTASKIIEKQG